MSERCHSDLRTVQLRNTWQTVLHPPPSDDRRSQGSGGNLGCAQQLLEMYIGNMGEMPRAVRSLLPIRASASTGLSPVFWNKERAPSRRSTAEVGGRFALRSLLRPQVGSNTCSLVMSNNNAIALGIWGIYFACTSSGSVVDSMCLPIVGKALYDEGEPRATPSPPPAQCTQLEERAVDARAPRPSAHAAF